MTHPALDHIWASLPMPAILLDDQDCIAEINSAAEGFLNASNKSVQGVPVFDKIMVDAPLEESYARAKSFQTPLFVNDVDVGTGDRAPLQCNLKFAPVVGTDDHVILLIAPRELAGRMTQTQTVKSAAHSAIGMAEMLAHEIKNPLAGITGAAQFLSLSLPAEDLEMTDLIVEESKRIVSLLDQVEQFGDVTPPSCAFVNIHDVLDRAARSAVFGFAGDIQIHKTYDPS